MGTLSIDKDMVKSIWESNKNMNMEEQNQAKSETKDTRVFFRVYERPKERQCLSKLVLLDTAN